MAKRTPLTLEQRLARVEEHLVGLWRFRVRGEKPKWCCTYVYNGCYHDTYGKEKPEEALDAVYRNIQQLRKKHERQ